MPERRGLALPLMLCCLAVVLGAGACGTRRPPEVTPAEQNPATASVEHRYRIGAGDTLEILVWKEPDVSGTVRVRPDGRITLPLTGDVVAAGLEPEELAARIHDRLTAYIDAPHVAVRVAEMGSRRFYVVGNVHTPGAYELRPNQTLLQAVAVAGGFTDFADRHALRVLREQDGETRVLTRNYDAVIEGRERDISLQPNDTVVVP